MSEPNQNTDPGELVKCSSCGDMIPAETTHKTDIGLLCDNCWENIGYAAREKQSGKADNNPQKNGK